MSEKKPVRLEDLSLDPEKYYFFFPMHNGDTFTALGFVRWFEKANNGKVVCLIRPSQEVIMRLFEIEDYELIDFDFTENGTLWQTVIAMSDMCPNPRRGAIFVALATAHLENRLFWESHAPLNHLQQYAHMYRVSGSPTDAFQKPTDAHIVVSDAFKQRLSAIAPVENIVLLSPETLSFINKGTGTIALKFWAEEAEKWTKRGFTVLVSSVSPLSIPNAHFFEMSLEEALWLGIHCKHVTARRSGYTDLLCFFQPDFTVVYPSYAFFATYNFFDLFHLHLDEIIIPDMKMRDKNGIFLPIIEDINRLADLKKERKTASLLSRFSFGKKKKIYKQKKKEIKQRISAAEETQQLMRDSSFHLEEGE